MALVRSDKVFVRAGDDNVVVKDSGIVLDGGVISCPSGNLRVRVWDVTAAGLLTEAGLNISVDIPAGIPYNLPDAPLGLNTGCVVSCNGTGTATFYVRKRM